MRTALRRFQVANFRCLSDVELVPDGRLTFLAGKNGSGKTSVLDAMQFVGRGGRDRRRD